MRQLTSIKDQQQARFFASYLAVQGIQASAEEADGEWLIWYHDDDDREQANKILAEYLQNPDDPKYEAAERKVRSVFMEADRLQQEITRDQKRLKKRWAGSWWHSYPATYVMIGICVVVAVLCTDWTAMKGGGMGPTLCNSQDSVLLNKMWVATQIVREEGGKKVRYFRVTVTPELTGKNLKIENWADTLEILKFKVAVTWESLKWTCSNGEVWRFITPIFLHGSILHILFNMMWLRSMGMAIEFTRGTKRFVLLCLVLAVTSNLGQLFWSGPAFLGMSGVVFGLIGYVWMKGKTQPQLGMGLEQQTIVMSILWLVMCMAGVFGNIANAAHLVGFFGGILIGARQAIWKKLPFRK
jgi:GlpG protein